MKHPRKMRLLRSLGLLALLAFAAWVVFQAPLGKIWQELSRMSLAQVGWLFLINVAIVLLFSLRWWLVLRSQGYAVPYFHLVGFRQAAFGFSYLTPGPQLGGLPMQIYLLHRRSGIPAETSTASVTLERLLEGMASLSFIVIGAGVALASGWLPGAKPGLVLLATLGTVSLPLGYLVAMLAGRRPVTRLFQLLDIPARWEAQPASKLNWLWSLIELVLNAEQQLSSFCRQKPLAVLATSAISVLFWLFCIFEYQLMLSFLGLPLSFWQALAALAAARVAFLLPLPGSVGVLEASQVLAMSAMGFDPTLGMAASLVIRGRDVLFASLGMLLWVWLSRVPGVTPLPAQAGD